MKLRKTYLREKKSIDIRNYSQFPQEEVLLKAGVEFTVESVNCIIEKKNQKNFKQLTIY